MNDLTPGGFIQALLGSFVSDLTTGMSPSARFYLSLLISVLIYIAPTILALSRGHREPVKLAIVNLLLGSGPVTWVAVLLWAMLGDVKTPDEAYTPRMATLLPSARTEPRVS